MAGEMVMTDKKQNLFSSESTNFIFEQCEITDEKQYAGLLKNILQSAPDATLIVNQRGRIIFANSQAEKAFGYTQAEILGEPIEILIPESYREKHTEHVKNYFQHPYTRPMGAGLNLVAERKNKEIFPVEICIAPIEVKNGLIAMATVRDITERKKMQEQIDEMNKRVLSSAKRAGMAEVVNTILHNMGNILNSANVSAGVLIDKTSQPDYVEKLKRIANLINEKSSQLSDYFIKDTKGKLVPKYLMNVTEIIENEHKKIHQELKNIYKQLSFTIDIISKQESAGGTSIFLEPTSLDEILEFAIKTGELENTGITIIKNIDREFSISTDKIKLLQILTSLIVNAKESLLESASPNKHITITVNKNNEQIDIFIQDNGSGISEENLKRLFLFGFSTKKERHGFGLHNSFLLAKELGGSLCAKSDGKNKGATFVLSLPLKN